jgi:low molecular weight protein-tyrosine phosphatase
VSLVAYQEILLPHSVLFVCLGNICRSPLAEGVFRALVEEAGLANRFTIDSAGTGAWHEGNPPDPRSIEIAAKYGIDISAQRARQVRHEDFQKFETILAMDNENLSVLRRKAGTKPTRIQLFLNTPPMSVPDPYYGGPDGFENVYQLVRSGSEDFLKSVI